MSVPLLMAAGSASAAGGALPAAILALSPLSYWDLRGSGAPPLNDQGSLGLDLSNNSVTLNNEAGGDGYNYPDTAGTAGAEHLSGSDSISYEPQNASGLTVFFLWKNTSGATGVLNTLNKIDSAGNGSWLISTTPSSGFIRARTITAAGGTARTRDVTALNTSDWSIVVVRFGGGASNFPGIRIDGVNQSGTTGGTGSGNGNSSQTIKLFGHGGSANHSECALAHVAIFAGQITDPQCAGLESAATADGW